MGLFSGPTVLAVAPAPRSVKPKSKQKNFMIGFYVHMVAQADARSIRAPARNLDEILFPRFAGVRDAEYRNPSEWVLDALDEH
jgi:hypothetical protein